MFGWIHSCLEKLVLTSHGDNMWQQIKNEAQCSEKNGDWIRYENYSDEQSFALFTAACNKLNIEKDILMEVFGGYFLEFMRDEGYLNMLKMLGTNLREWLGNVNTFHVHLKVSLAGRNLVEPSFPEFWCTDDEEADGIHESMIFHYFSNRGPYFSALNVGIVNDAAIFFFNVKIQMTRIALQDVDESPCTSWRIVILGPLEVGADGIIVNPIQTASTAATLRQVLRAAATRSHSGAPARCPFHR